MFGVFLTSSFARSSLFAGPMYPIGWAAASAIGYIRWLDSITSTPGSSGIRAEILATCSQLRSSWTKMGRNFAVRLD